MLEDGLPYNMDEQARHEMNTVALRAANECYKRKPDLTEGPNCGTDVLHVKARAELDTEEYCAYEVKLRDWQITCDAYGVDIGAPDDDEFEYTVLVCVDRTSGKIIKAIDDPNDELNALQDAIDERYGGVIGELPGGWGDYDALRVRFADIDFPRCMLESVEELSDLSTKDFIVLKITANYKMAAQGAGDDPNAYGRAFKRRCIELQYFDREKREFDPARFKVLKTEVPEDSLDYNPQPNWGQDSPNIER